MYTITIILCARGPDAFGHIVHNAPEIEFVGAYIQAHKAIHRVAALYNQGEIDHFMMIVASKEVV